MTLGRGLESLIPPKKQSTQVTGQQPQTLSNPTQPLSVTSEPQAPVLKTPISEAPSEPTAINEELNKGEVAAWSQMSTTQEPSKKVVEEISGAASGQYEPKKTDAIFQIEVDRIKPNPHQPRRNFDEEGLRELASSIREFGVIQPIIVSKIEIDSETGRSVEYELIAGERRLLASKMAGLRTVPAIIKRLTPEREKLEMAIIENIQRRDLNPIEEAKAFARLQDEFRLTQREIAAKLGKSREAVANTVRLLNLPSDIQQALSDGKLSESQGRLLLSIEDIAEQKKMFEEIMQGGLSVREIRLKIQKSKEAPVQKNEDFIKPETLALKEKLEEFLGTKVDLREEGDRGKITINFYSKEELQAILDKFLRQDS